jgi:hypothetical protein
MTQMTDCDKTACASRDPPFTPLAAPEPVTTHGQEKTMRYALLVAVHGGQPRGHLRLPRLLSEQQRGRV